MCVYLYTLTCLRVCVSVHAHVSACVWAPVCVCLCVHMHVCLYYSNCFQSFETLFMAHPANNRRNRVSLDLKEGKGRQSGGSCRGSPRSASGSLLLCYLSGTTTAQQRAAVPVRYETHCGLFLREPHTHSDYLPLLSVVLKNVFITSAVMNLVHKPNFSLIET